MDYITILGYLAALCSMVSFAPQAWKVIRSRDTTSISFWTYLLTVVGFLLWLAYGILKGEWPLVVSNSVCLSLSGFILAMKMLNAKQDGAAKPA